MLESCRVLDLSDHRGQLAGAMLAGLGADVILVEPPGGSDSRRQAPFVDRAPEAEASLSHWGSNRGKRSMVLDLAGSAGDRDAFRRLAATADVLIESTPPDVLGDAGIADHELTADNPGLVRVSISAFGPDGPKADWAATDITVWGAGMALTLTGDSDRPPVRVSLPQAFLHASTDAAVGALLALTERTRSGLGQRVDVSAQASVLQSSQSVVLATPVRASPARRMAGGIKAGPLDVQLLWPCKDGYVTITFLFGVHAGPFTHRLMHWVHEEGHCDVDTRDKNWIDYTTLLFSGEEPISEYERVKKCVESFTLTKTKAELLEGARAQRLGMAPVYTIADLLASEQLAERGYWDTVDDPVVSPRPIQCPGPFAMARATPLPRLGRPPRLGEHTAEVLAEIDAARPTAAPAAPAAPATADDRALAGLKVLDLCWILAGPTMGRVLADHGATVVRVESATHVEGLRTLTPFVDDKIDPETSALYLNTNAGKLGVALNLATPEAREVVLDLVRWADVVLESFSPKALKAWGLDYEALREVNPSIVMLSSCLFGQTGPLATFAGTGNMAAAMMGFYGITGWPDRWPAGPFGAYTDYLAPRFGLAALLGALDHRRRTGEGQYVDFSQAEGCIQLLSPAILDLVVNDVTLERRGNADPQLAPHGVYPCAGDDVWVAIACATDEHWRSLAGLLDRADLAGDAGLATGEGRLARAAELDDAVAAWTAGQTVADVVDRCQAAGVPAHGAATSEDCWADPQLAHWGHFVTVAHSMLGDITVEAPRFHLTRTPGRVSRTAPTLGEHTSEVLSEILGYDDDRIGDLYAAEALE